MLGWSGIRLSRVEVIYNFTRTTTVSRADRQPHLSRVNPSRGPLRAETRRRATPHRFRARLLRVSADDPRRPPALVAAHPHDRRRHAPDLLSFALVRGSRRRKPALVLARDPLSGPR
jgi:hypothetical protein